MNNSNPFFSPVTRLRSRSHVIESVICCQIGKNSFAVGRLVPLIRKKQFYNGLNRTLLTDQTEKITKPIRTI